MVLLRPPPKKYKTRTSNPTNNMAGLSENAQEKSETEEEKRAAKKAREMKFEQEMKARLKGFLENYELIPKVCYSLEAPICSKALTVVLSTGTDLHWTVDEDYPG